MFFENFRGQMPFREAKVVFGGAPCPPVAELLLELEYTPFNPTMKCKVKLKTAKAEKSYQRRAYHSNLELSTKLNQKWEPQKSDN